LPPLRGSLDQKQTSGAAQLARSAPPVCRRFAVPSIRNKLAGLRNSHDPLRGHVLKQCSPNIAASLLLIEAAHRGKKKQTQKHEGMAGFRPLCLLFLLLRNVKLTGEFTLVLESLDRLPLQEKWLQAH